MARRSSSTWCGRARDTERALSGCPHEVKADPSDIERNSVLGPAFFRIGSSSRTSDLFCVFQYHKSHLFQSGSSTCYDISAYNHCCNWSGQRICCFVSGQRICCFGWNRRRQRLVCDWLWFWWVGPCDTERRSVLASTHFRPPHPSLVRLIRAVVR